MVEFIGVHKFNLRNIDFKVEKGEFIVLHGNGGAGKTTLLKLAYGELCPDKGTVKVFDGKVWAPPSTQTMKRKVGYIPQDGSLLEDKDVMTNVEVPLKLLGEYDRRKVLSILHKFGLYEYHKVQACELPCSIRQLLKVALPVAKNPLLVIADEPLQNLDPEQAKLVLSIFSDMNATGITILFATSQSFPTSYTRKFYISNGEIRNAYE